MTSNLDHLDAAKSKDIIVSLINHCKRAIRYFKMKNARRNRACIELENIAGDFKDVDLAILYVEYVQRQKVYDAETLQERRKRVSISRSQENIIHLLQLLKEELTRKRVLKERMLKIIDSETLEVMQWLEELSSPNIEGKFPPSVPSTQQGDLTSYSNDICIFEMVIMLYEWGERVIVKLMAKMIKSSESEMVVNFGKMFEFLSDILLFLPHMADQMVERFKREEVDEIIDTAINLNAC